MRFEHNYPSYLITPSPTVQLWCNCNNSGLKEPRSMEKSIILNHSIKIGKHVWCEKTWECYIGKHNKLPDIQAGARKPGMV